MNVSRALNVASRFLLIAAFGALIITCKQNSATVACALDGGTDAPSSMDGSDDGGRASDGMDGAPNCAQPGGPRAALTDVCSMSGTICVAGDGSCPTPSTNWDVDVSLVPTLPSESDVPSCSFREEPAVPPGWQLKVEKVPPTQLRLNTIDHYDTRIVATRVGNGATCSVIIAVEIRGERLILPVGSTIQYTRKYVIRNPETDASISTAIRDSNGKLLVGYVADMRPDVWDADVLPELKMALTPVCARGPGDTALNVSLSSGTDMCSADDGTARCCSLGGETFQMEVPGARRYPGTAPSDKVTMLIAKSGIILPAP